MKIGATAAHQRNELILQKNLAKSLFLLLCNNMVTNESALARSAFNAISDPTRRAILDHLREGELGAGEIAKRFTVSRPAIARHVRILRKTGLVRERREAQRRFYTLEPHGLEEIDRWLAPYRLFWAARLTDLKSFVENNENSS